MSFEEDGGMDSVHLFNHYDANVSNEGLKKKIVVENTSISSIYKVACSDTLVVAHIGTDMLQDIGGGFKGYHWYFGS